MSGKAAAWPDLNDSLKWGVRLFDGCPTFFAASRRTFSCRRNGFLQGQVSRMLPAASVANQYFADFVLEVARLAGFQHILVDDDKGIQMP